MSPRDAVRLIRDGDVVADSGLGGTAARLDHLLGDPRGFEQTGHPAGLTVMNLGGHGGRGMAPGTLEELGAAGLCTPLRHRPLRDLPRHARSRRGRQLRAAVSAARRPWRCCSTRSGAAAPRCSAATGVGTFLDPRVGRGSPVAGGREQLVAVRATPALSHPAIDVAIFNVPAADRHGNLYAKTPPSIGESARDRARGEAQRRPGDRQRRPPRRRGPRPRLPPRRHGRCGRLLSGYRADRRRSSTATTGRRSPPRATCRSRTALRARALHELARRSHAAAHARPTRRWRGSPPRRCSPTSRAGRLRQHRRRLARGGVPGHFRGGPARRPDLPRRERRRRRLAGAGHLLRRRALAARASSPRRSCSSSVTSGSTPPVSACCRSTARQRQRLQARRRRARLRRPGRLHRLHRRRRDHRLRLGVDGARRARGRGTAMRIATHGTPKFVEHVDEITFNGPRRCAPASTSSTPPTSGSSG